MNVVDEIYDNGLLYVTIFQQSNSGPNLMAGWSQPAQGPKSTPMQPTANKTPTKSSPQPPGGKVDPFASFGNFSSSSNASKPMGAQQSPQQQQQKGSTGPQQSQGYGQGMGSPSHGGRPAPSQPSPQKTAQTPPPQQQQQQQAKPNYYAGFSTGPSVIGGREDRGKRGGGEY